MTHEQHSYGWVRDPLDPRDRVFRTTAPVAIPASLDMRPLQPPIFDQLSLSSCTGNGIAAELEAQALAQKEPLDVLSRLFIYYQERNMEGDVDSDAGAAIRDGIKAVATQGVCPESEWPYDISKFAVRPPASCYQDALKFRALTYESVTQNLIQLKLALARGRGVVCGLTLYDSFESDAVANSGIVPLPSAGENVLGGHCVRLVGYTDRKLADVPAQHFICANSWGTGWGLKGYFALPYAYVANSELASDFWSITAVA